MQTDNYLQLYRKKKKDASANWLQSWRQQRREAINSRLSSYKVTPGEDYVSKALVFLIFFMCSRIGEYISLELFN